MTILPRASACYRCAFPTEPQDAPSCSEAGVIGPAAGVIGSLMALEAIKLLSGTAAPLMDAFLTDRPRDARHDARPRQSPRGLPGLRRVAFPSGCGV